MLDIRLMFVCLKEANGASPLNLSRAWCLRGVAALPEGDPSRAASASSVDRYAGAALGRVASGDYAGEHWLTSFAVYLLTTSTPD